MRAAARSLGVDIESICAENSTCGKCKVLIEEGNFERYGITSRREHLSPPGTEEAEYFAQERRRWPQRLDARSGAPGMSGQVSGDRAHRVPEESRADKQIVRKSATERIIEIKPSIRKYLVEMNPPTLSQPKADWERLASGIATSIELVRYGEARLAPRDTLTIDYACLQTLSETLREANWRVTVSVWQDKEVIRVEPGLDDRLYGAAVDIGTTTVALYLCDLERRRINRRRIRDESSDRLRRGRHVSHPVHDLQADGLRTLHKAIIRVLNQLLTRRRAGRPEYRTEDILELVVVGNTTMHHFFLNLSRRSIWALPVRGHDLSSLDIKARELGLAINKSAQRPRAADDRIIHRRGHHRRAAGRGAARAD